MPSKISFFNKTIFLKNITRFWPLWLAYLVLWILIVPVSFITSIEWNASLRTEAGAGYNLLSSTTEIGVFMAFLFGILAAMAVFSYLYSGKSAGMMASLPVTRREMFTTNYLSGLICLVGSNIAVFGLTALLQIFYGCFHMVYLLEWLAIASMQIVFFYSFACLCAVLTGHILVLPAVYTVLNFTAVIVESLTKSLLQSILYGFRMTVELAATFLSPVLYIPKYHASLVDQVTGELYGASSFSYGYSGFTAYGEEAVNYANFSVVYNGWKALILYTIVGVFMAVLAYVIFRKRQMETASDVVSVKVLKPIFKYCMTFGCALVIGLGLMSILFAYSNGAGNIVIVLACLLVGAFVGYFAAEMLMQKSFRVFGAWKGFAVSALVILVLVTACEMDIFGYEKKIPDADTVESVEITCNGETVTFKTGENIESVCALHKSIVDHKKVYEKNGGEYELQVEFAYDLEEGVLSRAYMVPISSDTMTDKTSDGYVLNQLFNAPEALQSRQELKIPVTVGSVTYASVYYFDKNIQEYVSLELTPQQAVELYTNCIAPDSSDGALGQVWFYTGNGYSAEYYETVYDCTVEIELSLRKNNGEYAYDYLSVMATVDSTRTNAYLEELGVQLNLINE